MEEKVQQGIQAVKEPGELLQSGISSLVLPASQVPPVPTEKQIQYIMEGRDPGRNIRLFVRGIIGKPDWRELHFHYFVDTEKLGYRIGLRGELQLDEQGNIGPHMWFEADTPDADEYPVNRQLALTMARVETQAMGKPFVDSVAAAFASPKVLGKDWSSRVLQTAPGTSNFTAEPLLADPEIEAMFLDRAKSSPALRDVLARQAWSGKFGRSRQNTREGDVMFPFAPAGRLRRTLKAGNYYEDASVVVSGLPKSGRVEPKASKLYPEQKYNRANYFAYFDKLRVEEGASLVLAYDDAGRPWAFFDRGFLLVRPGSVELLRGNPELVEKLFLKGAELSRELETHIAPESARPLKDVLEQQLKRDSGLEESISLVDWNWKGSPPVRMGSPMQEGRSIPPAGVRIDRPVLNEVLSELRLLLPRDTVRFFIDSDAIRLLHGPNPLRTIPRPGTGRQPNAVLIELDADHAFRVFVDAEGGLRIVPEPGARVALVTRQIQMLQDSVPAQIHRLQPVLLEVERIYQGLTPALQPFFSGRVRELRADLGPYTELTWWNSRVDELRAQLRVAGKPEAVEVSGSVFIGPLADARPQIESLLRRNLIKTISVGGELVPVKGNPVDIYIEIGRLVPAGVRVKIERRDLTLRITTAAQGLEEAEAVRRETQTIVEAGLNRLPQKVRTFLGTLNKAGWDALIDDPDGAVAGYKAQKLLSGGDPSKLRAAVVAARKTARDNVRRAEAARRAVPAQQRAATAVVPASGQSAGLLFPIPPGPRQVLRMSPDGSVQFVQEQGDLSVPGKNVRVEVQPPPEPLNPAPALRANIDRLYQMLVDAGRSIWAAGNTTVNIQPIKAHILATIQTRFQTQVPDVVDSGQLNWFLSELEWRYFLPIGEFFSVVRVPGGDVSPLLSRTTSRWGSAPYLGGRGTVWFARATHVTGPLVLGQSKADIALVDIDSARAHAEQWYQGLMAIPNPAPIIVEMQRVMRALYAESPEEYRKVFGSDLAEVEEFRHSRDAVWSFLFFGREMRLHNWSNILEVEAMLRPGSPIDQRIWTPDKTRQIFQNPSALVELAGQLGSMTEMMQDLLLDGKDLWAYGLFLRFLHDKFNEREGLSTIQGMAYKGPVAEQVFDHFARAGFADALQMIAYFNRPQQGPQGRPVSTPGARAYELIKRMYVENFFTDPEREFLLTGRLPADGGLEEGRVAQGTIRGVGNAQFPVSVYRTPADIGRVQAEQLMQGWGEAARAGNPYVIGLATGSTPEPLLAELVSRLNAMQEQERAAHLAQLYIIAMDDIVDPATGTNVPPTHERSAYKFFQDRLFSLVPGMTPEWVSDRLMVPTVGQVTAQVERVRRLGGVRWQLMATDPNEGHVAEVAAGELLGDPAIRAAKDRPRQLSPLFLRHNPWANRYLGITLTLDDFADYMAPDGVVSFAAFGAAKADIVRRFCDDGRYNADRPITFLWMWQLSDKTEILLDEASAAEVRDRLGLEEIRIGLARSGQPITIKRSAADPDLSGTILLGGVEVGKLDVDCTGSLLVLNEIQLGPDALEPDTSRGQGVGSAVIRWMFQEAARIGITRFQSTVTNPRLLRILYRGGFLTNAVVGDLNSAVEQPSVPLAQFYNEQRVDALPEEFGYFQVLVEGDVVGAGAEELMTLTPQQIDQLFDLRERVYKPEVRSGFVDPGQFADSDARLEEDLRAFAAEPKTAAGVRADLSFAGDRRNKVCAVAVAVANGQPVGYAVARINRRVREGDPPTVEFLETALEPAFRERGLGRRMFRALLEQVLTIPRLIAVYLEDGSAGRQSAQMAQEFGFRFVTPPSGDPWNTRGLWVLDLDDPGTPVLLAEQDLAMPPGAEEFRGRSLPSPQDDKEEIFMRMMAIGNVASELRRRGQAPAWETVSPIFLGDNQRMRRLIRGTGWSIDELVQQIQDVTQGNPRFLALLAPLYAEANLRPYKDAVLSRAEMLAALRAAMGTVPADTPAENRWDADGEPALLEFIGRALDAVGILTGLEEKLDPPVVEALNGLANAEGRVAALRARLAAMTPAQRLQFVGALRWAANAPAVVDTLRELFLSPVPEAAQASQLVLEAVRDDPSGMAGRAIQSICERMTSAQIMPVITAVNARLSGDSGWLPGWEQAGQLLIENLQETFVHAQLRNYREQTSLPEAQLFDMLGEIFSARAGRYQFAGAASTPADNQDVEAGLSSYCYLTQAQLLRILASGAPSQMGPMTQIIQQNYERIRTELQAAAANNPSPLIQHRALEQLVRLEQLQADYHTASLDAGQAIGSLARAYDAEQRLVVLRRERAQALGITLPISGLEEAAARLFEQALEAGVVRFDGGNAVIGETRVPVEQLTGFQTEIAELRRLGFFQEGADTLAIAVNPDAQLPEGTQLFDQVLIPMIAIPDGTTRIMVGATPDQVLGTMADREISDKDAVLLRTDLVTPDQVGQWLPPGLQPPVVLGDAERMKRCTDAEIIHMVIVARNQPGKVLVMQVFSLQNYKGQRLLLISA